MQTVQKLTERSLGVGSCRRREEEEEEMEGPGSSFLDQEGHKASYTLCVVADFLCCLLLVQCNQIFFTKRTGTWPKASF